MIHTLPCLPVSSERHEVVTPPPHDWLHYHPPSAVWRRTPRSPILPSLSAIRSDIEPCPDPDRQHQHQQHQHQQGTSQPIPVPRSGGGGCPRDVRDDSDDSRRSPQRLRDWDRHEDKNLMQEGGAPGIGSLALEGAEEHGRECGSCMPGHFGSIFADFFFFQTSSSFTARLTLDPVSVSASPHRNDTNVTIAAKVMHGGSSAPDVTDTPYRSSGDAELLRQIRQLDGALPKRSLCGQFVAAFFDKYNS